jgi:uncharacterized membrane protein YkvA (DUF1232 family)
MMRLLLVLAAAAVLYFWWRPPTRSAVWRGGKLPLVGAALLALAYLLSPVDALPDVTPIGLIDDLIILVTTGWWIYDQWRRRPRPAEPEPAAAGGATASWDPYRVLEVRRGASRDEITRAYRAQMKRYHPDRVGDLGDELQEVAHRKTLEIQRAFIELTEG